MIVERNVAGHLERTRAVRHRTLPVRGAVVAKVPNDG
jgi:hypothetical protein